MIDEKENMEEITNVKNTYVCMYVCMYIRMSMILVDKYAMKICRRWSRNDCGDILVTQNM